MHRETHGLRRGRSSDRVALRSALSPETRHAQASSPNPTLTNPGAAAGQGAALTRRQLGLPFMWAYPCRCVHAVGEAKRGVALQLALAKVEPCWVCLARMLHDAQ